LSLQHRTSHNVPVIGYVLRVQVNLINYLQKLHLVFSQLAT